MLERFRDAKEQRASLDAAIANSDAPWKFVFGHPLTGVFYDERGEESDRDAVVC